MCSCAQATVGWEIAMNMGRAYKTAMDDQLLRHSALCTLAACTRTDRTHPQRTLAAHAHCMHCLHTLSARTGCTHPLHSPHALSALTALSARHCR